MMKIVSFMVQAIVFMMFLFIFTGLFFIPGMSTLFDKITKNRRKRPKSRRDFIDHYEEALAFLDDKW